MQWFSDWFKDTTFERCLPDEEVDKFRTLMECFAGGYSKQGTDASAFIDAHGK